MSAASASSVSRTVVAAAPKLRTARVRPGLGIATRAASGDRPALIARRRLAESRVLSGLGRTGNRSAPSGCFLARAIRPEISDREMSPPSRAPISAIE